MITRLLNKLFHLNSYKLRYNFYSYTFIFLITDYHKHCNENSVANKHVASSKSSIIRILCCVTDVCVVSVASWSGHFTSADLCRIVSVSPTCTRLSPGNRYFESIIQQFKSPSVYQCQRSKNVNLN